MLAKTWYFCPMFKDNPSFWLCISVSNLQSMGARQEKFKHMPDRRDSREISQHPNLSGQTLFKSSGGRLNVGWHTVLAYSCSWLIYYTITSPAVPTSWSKTPTPWLYESLLRWVGRKLKEGRLVHDKIKFDWSAYLRTQTKAGVYLLGWIHAVVDVWLVLSCCICTNHYWRYKSCCCCYHRQVI